MPSINSRKLYVKQGIYHVYNRGVERRAIIFADRDREHMLRYMDEGSKRFNVVVLKYALTTNHYHMIIQQQDDPRAIAKFMQSMGTRYANYINFNYDRVGPLFQGRYNARLLVTAKEVMTVHKYLEHHESAEIAELEDFFVI